MHPDLDATAVLARYPQLGPPCRLEPLSGAGGFSGAQLWRIETNGGSYCLRRWPREHPTPGRLQLIHAVLRHAGASGIDFIPVPLFTALSSNTFISHSGHLWELAPWLPGKADYQANPSRARLSAAFQALAVFHVSASSFPVRSHGPAPTLIERGERLAKLQHNKYEQIATAVCRAAPSPVVDCGKSLLQLFPLLAPQAAGRLTAAAQVSVPLMPAIRDIWHDHVLFTGDVVTGIIDFGAMRMDTPLTDIARLLGSLAGDDRDAREFALDSYHTLRPLSDQDRWLIDVLDTSGTLLAGFSWLEWLYLDRRDFADLDVVHQRLDGILVRLQHQLANRA